MDISPSFVLQVLTIFLWLGTVLSVFLGGFTWLQNKRSPVNILFALSSVSIAFLLGGSVQMFNSCGTPETAYFWDKVVYCGVVFIPIFLLHLSLVLSGEKNKIYKTFVLPAGYAIAVIFLFSIWFFPEFFIQGLFTYKWGCHAIAQPGHNLFLIYYIGYLLWFFYKTFRLWRTTQDPVLRVQSKYIFFSFLFLFPNSFAFLPAYKIAVFPIEYACSLVWILILTYAITQRNLLNAKVIIVDVLAALVVFTVLVYAMFSSGAGDMFIKLAFLTLIIGFAWLAVRGVHREINEKERLGTMVKERTRELEESKKIAEEAKMAAEEAKKVAEDRAAELEKWYNATIGRELRMAELKKRMDEMEEQLKKK